MAKILVVDDDPQDRELARRCLEAVSETVEVLYAVDGKEAVASIRRTPPDVVLTDLRMPRMDGLELVRHIRDHHPLIPVILMTARGSEQIAVDALEAGAASYVPKKDLRQELVDTIEQVLDVSETHRSRAEILQFLDRRETCFELPNDIGLIVPLVAYFQESLGRRGFGGEGTRTQIGIALMEAISNAMVRGNLEVGSELRRTDRAEYDRLIEERAAQEPYASRRVVVEAIESAGGVRYTVKDQGPGFDPDTVPDPTAAENLLAVSGRGIMLMRTFMDDVEFNPLGNTVTLTKRGLMREVGQPEVIDDPDAGD
jgi:CheY-like chemotaxis protein